MSALNVLCAQLTRDLFAIAKFLFVTPITRLSPSSFVTPFVHCAFACHGNADKEKKTFLLQRISDKCIGGGIIWPPAVFSSLVWRVLTSKRSTIAIAFPSVCLTRSNCEKQRTFCRIYTSCPIGHGSCSVAKKRENICNPFPRRWLFCRNVVWKKSRFSTNRFVSEMMVSHVPTAVWNDDANRNSKWSIKWCHFQWPQLTTIGLLTRISSWFGIHCSKLVLLLFSRQMQ